MGFIVNEICIYVIDQIEYFMQQRDLEHRGNSTTEKPCYLWLSQKPISKLTDRQIIEIHIVLKKLTTLEISAALTKVEKSLENSKLIKPYQIPIIALEVFRHRETNDMLNDITNRRRSTTLFSSLRNYSFRKNNKVTPTTTTEIVLQTTNRPNKSKRFVSFIETPIILN